MGLTEKADLKRLVGVGRKASQENTWSKATEAEEIARAKPSGEITTHV